MRKPRTNILLSTMILVVGLVGWAWLVRDSDSASPGSSGFTAAQVARAMPVRGDPLLSPTDFADGDSLDGIHLSGASCPVLPPQLLSDDAGMLVAKMCELHLLADGTDFTLDSSQWSAFATVVLRFQAIRQTYEASIASLRVVAPGQYRMEVPAYAGVGDELREQFAAELRAALGEPKAREVIMKLGSRLEDSFAGFGISEQTLDITANAAGQPGDIQVTRTAKYWNSTEDSERLTTRCETHLPALEDPTGDNWGALLAMVKAETSMNGPG